MKRESSSRVARKRFCVFPHVIQKKNSTNHNVKSEEGPPSLENGWGQPKICWKKGNPSLELKCAVGMRFLLLFLEGTWGERCWKTSHKGNWGVWIEEIDRCQHTLEFLQSKRMYHKNPTNNTNQEM